MKKLVLGALILSVTGKAVADGCPPVIDPIWQSGMNTASGTLSSQIQFMEERVNKARALNLTRIQSALRVLTKQIEVSNDQQAATEIAAKHASANYMVEL